MTATQQFGSEQSAPVPRLRPDLDLFANDEGNHEILEHDLAAARVYISGLERDDSAELT